ncbi:fimbrial protein [Enterobacter asburiae]|uniref:fimbrial protein n=1 Tax=Enterobacter asburiae TaxID=61645 RepID=UPI00292C2D6B|nr:fimbrial protein [Enterobacter asburiae]MDV1928490.1 fimbrial protein [Enterobacter asburiae]MDV1993127.1 fimbrial protein [Enterobacter asburiae]
MKFYTLAITILVGAILSNSSFADDNNINVTVKVTVQKLPCEINNNQVIDVDFGDSVITTDVARGVIEKVVNYTLDCTNADESKTLVMRINGSGAAFDNTLLKTNISELGIKVKVDGQDFPLNGELNLANATSKPELKAQLVQQPGTHLPTGGFTASATMMVGYQ